MRRDPGMAGEFQKGEWPRDARLTARMHRMFYPETIAVLGASRHAGKWGNRIVQSVLAADYPGRCVPVNPKGGEILGARVARNLAEISGDVDLALVVVSPSVVLKAIQECVGREVGSIFVVTAGFSEVDTAGHEIEKQMADLVRPHSIPLAGPNGQGLTCTQAGVCAQMFPLMPPRGGISVVAQSGNIGVSMAHFSFCHNVGLSKIISAGNEAFLTTAHYLDYLALDDDTDVVALYLEGVDQGRHLFSALKRLCRLKPVVVLKSGHTADGAKAAVSHTGSLAGSDRVYDGAFRQAGAVRVHSVEEMFDTAATFATQPLPAGSRVGIVTVGGGWGVLAADAAASEGLEQVLLPDEIKSELDRILPARWSRSNPIDFAAGEEPNTRIRTLQMLLGSDAFDSVVFLGEGLSTVGSHFIGASKLGGAPATLQAILRMSEADRDRVGKVVQLAARYGKPLINASDAVLSARAIRNPAIETFRNAGQYVLASPDRALRVLGHLTRYAAFRRRQS